MLWQWQLPQTWPEQNTWNLQGQQLIQKHITTQHTRVPLVQVRLNNSKQLVGWNFQWWPVKITDHAALPWTMHNIWLVTTTYLQQLRQFSTLYNQQLTAYATCKYRKWWACISYMFITIVCMLMITWPWTLPLLIQSSC